METGKGFDYAALYAVALEEASGVLTTSDWHEAEDIAQEAVVALDNYASRHEVHNPGGCIRVITRRLAIKARGRWQDHYGEPVLGVGKDPSGGADPPAGGEERWRGMAVVEPEAAGGDPWVEFDAAATLELIHVAIEQLPDTDRRIARLAYLNEPPLRAPQIADQLGLASGTVRNHLVEIRRTLAALVNEDRGLVYDILRD